MFLLLGFLFVFLMLPSAQLSPTLHSQSEHHSSNKLGVFAQHSMLGMFLYNEESTRYLAKAASHSEPNFCRNLSLSAEVMPKFLINSGKSPNDLGFYDDCRYLSENVFLANYSQPQYSVMGLSYMGGAFKWGFCYPAQCYKTMNDTIYEVTSLLSFKIEYEVIDKFEPISEARWESILMLIVLSFLILLGIIGTIVHLTSVRKINKLVDSSQTAQISHSSAQILQRLDGIPKLMTCFSFRLNLPRLLTRQRPPSPTDVLDGVRVLSIIWVVYGHSYFFPALISANNLANAYLTYTQQFFFSIVPQGVLAVDTFFFLSAFLATYILLQKLPSTSKCPIKMVPFLYLRRYYRLTPLLAFIMYFCAFVIYPLAQGPMRQSYSSNIDKCKENGWATLLYINNYYPQSVGDVCFGWTWYLSIDIHLFLLLPFYVLLYNISALAGYIFLTLSLVANLIVTYYVAYSNNLGVGMISNPDVDYFKVFYTKFYIRSGAYLVGIFFGIFYFNYIKEKKVRDQDTQLEQQALMPPRIRKRNCAYSLFASSSNSTKIAWTYMLVGFVLTFLCVFLIYWPTKSKNLNYWSKGARSLYNALQRPVFVTGLALVLIPLLAGRFSALRSILGHQSMVVLSRLSYSVYLIHEVILSVFLISQKTTAYFTHLEGAVITFSMLVLSYIFGGVMTLLVESPLSNLDKHYFFKEQK